jgi:hypothetical protein
VSVDGTAATNHVDSDETKTADNLKETQNSVLSYIRLHQLDEHLNKAVNKVVRNKCEQPLLALAAELVRQHEQQKEEAASSLPTNQPPIIMSSGS